MTEMDINGVTYHIEAAGSGAPLVLLHGFTGAAANWRAHIAAFAQHYHVIAPDLPGHGGTTAPDDRTRYNMAHAAADLAAICHTVAGEPVHLLGYSMGGRLALYTALYYPGSVRTLILESASPGLAHETERADRREQDNALAERIERDGVAAFVDMWERLPLWESQQRLSAEARAHLRAQRLTNNPRGLANSLRGMGTGVQPSLWGDLGKLAMPVLLLTGALDAKFERIAREMAARIPEAQHVSIPDAGHTVHLEQPKPFQRAVLAFIGDS